MRLRRGIVALVVLGSVQLPAAMRASAATNAVTFPSSVTFPIVTLPVFDTGPRLAVTVRNDTASSVKLGVPRIEGANAALFSIVGVKEPRTVLPGDAWAYNVEFLRFSPDSPVTGPIREQPHIAYRVLDLAAAIEGHDVILGPFGVGDGFLEAAFVLVDDVVVEFMQYRDPDEEGWF